MKSYWSPWYWFGALLNTNPSWRTVRVTPRFICDSWMNYFWRIILVTSFLSVAVCSLEFCLLLPRWAISTMYFFLAMSLYWWCGTNYLKHIPVTSILSACSVSVALRFCLRLLGQAFWGVLSLWCHFLVFRLRVEWWRTNYFRPVFPVMSFSVGTREVTIKGKLFQVFSSSFWHPFQCLGYQRIKNEG